MNEKKEEYHMSEIIFKDLSIQKGDRIKIPKAIVDTLSLNAGQKIVIFFDPEKKQIRIINDNSNKELKKGD
jgi:bifunctional DNA-binding transcriptional regulator/antitoxin component of YhaV-PrlF toxin-antitoxin module